MAISKINPVAATSSINAKSITATAPDTLYSATTEFKAAIYNITCTSSTVAIVEFYSSTGNLITSTTTVSGSATINLASDANRVSVWTDNGTNIVVTITKIAEALTSSFSGTLDTITSSGTYTGTSTSGFGYVVVVGAGGGGQGGWHNGSYHMGGTGGGSGAVGAKYVALTGSMPVTIGTAGAGGPGGYSYENVNGKGSDGGSTTFAGITAPGGKGGLGSNYESTGASIATGGTYNIAGANGGYGANLNFNTGGAASVTSKIMPFVPGGAGTTGGGGGGNGGTNTVIAQVGSGIGTGGGGGRPNNINAIPGSGYGFGGGGGSSSNSSTFGNGGNGGPGVVYVLKF